MSAAAGACYSVDMGNQNFFQSFWGRTLLKLLAWEAGLILLVWLVYQWAHWGQRFAFSDVLFLIGALELGVASGDARRYQMTGGLLSKVLPGPQELPEHTPVKTYFPEDFMENHSLAARLIASGLLTILIAIAMHLAT